MLKILKFMAGKKILYKEEARSALTYGMSIMVEAVAATLGPKGRNVVQKINMVLLKLLMMV